MINYLHNAVGMKISLALMLATLLTFIPITTASAASSLSVPFTSQQGISGVFNITSFGVQAGKLVARGTLEFLLNGVQQIVKVVATVTSVTGSCTILDLTIGPINIDLLGLVIDTNTIHLKITAEQGAGNLLGNLLCAVANLLNPGGFTSLTGGALSQLGNLLNQIIAAL